MFRVPHAVIAGAVLCALACGDGAGTGPGVEPPDPAGWDVAPEIEWGTTAGPHEVEAPAPARAEHSLLNEVLFLAPAFGATWVEIKVGSGANPLTGLSLENEAGLVVMIRPAMATEAGILQVVFDGGTSVTRGIVHTGPPEFLERTRGILRLLGPGGRELDRVSWGQDRRDAVRLGGGGVLLGAQPGMTIGRIPASAASGAGSDWALYDAADSTPGRPNLHPPVPGLATLFGTVFDSTSAALSWYPAPGAAHYLVEVAAAETFRPLDFQKMADRPSVTVDNLAAGTHHWRVQAIAADGSKSPYSAVGRFIVRQGAAPSAGTKLENVVSLSQRKDTRMLVLQSNRGGPDDAHGFDRPHPATDGTDPADNANAVPAAAAMLARTFGGRLSQDRIGFEVLKDANYGRGVARQGEVEKAISWALADARLEVVSGPFDADRLWRDVKREINLRHPLVLLTWNIRNASPLLPYQLRAGSHAAVIAGYTWDESSRYLWVLNPWNESGESALLQRVRLDSAPPFEAYYKISGEGAPSARSDEATLAMDSDQDGIVDFDETVRFHTDPMKADSDDDCLPDKVEIESSMFDPAHGLAPFSNPPGVGDGAARSGAAGPEASTDSDQGGVPDFVEDHDLDGLVEADAGETSPYDPSDDLRRITGWFRAGEERMDAAGGLSREVRVDYMLSTGSGGKFTGPATATHKHRTHEERAPSPPMCPDPHRVETLMEDFQEVGQIEGKFTCTLEPGKNPVLTLTRVDPMAGMTFSQNARTMGCGVDMPGMAGPFPRFGEYETSGATVSGSLGEVTVRLPLTRSGAGGAEYTEAEIHMSRVQ